MPRSFTKPRVPLSLTDAVVRAVSVSGGVESAAALPGNRVGKTSMQKYTDDNEAAGGHVIPMDVAVLLSRDAVARGDEPHLLLYFQEQVMSAAPRMDEDSLLSLAAKVGKESGEVMAELSAALCPSGPGGKNLTAAERFKLQAQLVDLARVAQAGILFLQDEGV